jgi:hypothetical protein
MIEVVVLSFGGEKLDEKQADGTKWEERLVVVEVDIGIVATLTTTFHQFIV